MAQISLEQFNGLVDTIYSAGADPAKWHELVDQLDRVLDGVYLTLYGHDMRSGLAMGQITSRYSQEYLDRYIEYYSQINPFPKAMAHLQPMDFRACGQKIDRSAFMNSEFYNDFLKPQENIGGGAGGMLCNTQDQMLILAGHVRLKQEEKKTELLLETFNLLAPHIRRAFEMQRVLQGQKIEARVAELALDRVGHSVFLLNDQAKILFANGSARKLLRLGHAVREDREKRLCLRDQHAETLMMRALAHREHDSLAVGAASFVVQIEAGVRVVATLNPFRLDDEIASEASFLMDGGNAASILVLANAKPELAAASEALALLYNLTPAECGIAVAVARGEALLDISGRKNISLNTVRNQLKSVYDKSGVRSQSALTALVHRLAP
ncbi:LuxR C-terminal-related transcriptional regulator [Roseovarius sp. EL26]|uniref:helix-turn-helix transcriptional regulator n=1 Tax=Roseovarius sp. EL26 TaxID=2126672 RepID=UPI000EA0A9DF|nr:LuxR C-terminal-related transcriptional regulator [Roseovarius sp. EL26]